jgi:putative ABC transport system substrate-binding protein
MIRLVIAVLLVSISVAEAQQPKRVSRIGYFSAFNPTLESLRSQAIRHALRELGYVEGQNIVIEFRYMQGKLDRAPELTADLVRRKVDLIIVAGGSGPILAAKNATKTIPIVMAALSGDPVDLGLVESLARPGGNVTGLTTLSRELGGKRLELLKDIVPKLSRVGILYDATIPSGTMEVKEDLPAAVRGLGLTAQYWGLRAVDDFDRVFAKIGKDRPAGLYVTSGGLMNRNLQRIGDFTLKSRLPSVYSNREFIDIGGLMFYGADLAESYRRVAYYVDRILKGARPADLPVEQPTKFELVINLKTAKQIGLKIPPEVLARASKVIR